MDRALVHSEKEKQDLDIELVFNIPFAVVAKPYIEQLRSRDFDYDEYLKYASTMDKLPNVWNIAAVDKSDGKLLMFIWGNFDMLEKIMQVVRITAHPSTFGIRNLNAWMFDVVKRFGQQMGMYRIIFITDKYRAWLKKLDGEVYINENARILEFY